MVLPTRSRRRGARPVRRSLDLSVEPTMRTRTPPDPVQLIRVVPGVGQPSGSQGHSRNCGEQINEDCGNAAMPPAALAV
jgi:hypothetical protein